MSRTKSGPRITGGKTAALHAKLVVNPASPASPGGTRLFAPGLRLTHQEPDLIFRAVEDADLIRQAARGSVEAFNLLVSRWEKRVYNYLLRITANREDALDLTQDVFLKAYQNLRKLDDPGRFAPWLYRIAHNEAYTMFRKRRPETDVDEIELEGTETGITVGGNAVFPIELNLAVASALGRLSPDQREAVVLKIYQGFKFEEMADILACPVSTVKSRVYTALELLKVELAPMKARGVS
jgi:RNA polymerase sigma-70 factor (ECF subfamily)